MPPQHPRPPHHPGQQRRPANNAPVPALDPHDPTHVPYVPAPPSMNVPTPPPMRLGFDDPPSATVTNLPRLLPTLRWNGGSGIRDAAPAPPSSAFELVSASTDNTTLPLLRWSDQARPGPVSASVAAAAPASAPTSGSRPSRPLPASLPARPAGAVPPRSEAAIRGVTPLPAEAAPHRISAQSPLQPSVKTESAVSAVNVGSSSRRVERDDSGVRGKDRSDEMSASAERKQSVVARGRVSQEDKGSDRGVGAKSEDHPDKDKTRTAASSQPAQASAKPPTPDDGVADDTRTEIDPTEIWPPPESAQSSIAKLSGTMSVVSLTRGEFIENVREGDQERLAAGQRRRREGSSQSIGAGTDRKSQRVLSPTSSLQLPDTALGRTTTSTRRLP